LIQAYLFINLDTERSQDNILDSIDDIEEVKEAYRLYGTYDLVLFIEAENTSKLKEVTLRSVRQLKFVSSTMTMIALDAYIKEN
jgi:DNA-binding Lrp family transcriptional regulator